MKKEKLENKGWTEIKDGKWIKKDAFIDMQDGSSYMCFDDAVKLQKIIGEWSDDNE